MNRKVLLYMIVGILIAVAIISTIVSVDDYNDVDEEVVSEVSIEPIKGQEIEPIKGQELEGEKKAQEVVEQEGVSEDETAQEATQETNKDDVKQQASPISEDEDKSNIEKEIIVEEIIVEENIDEGEIEKEEATEYAVNMDALFKSSEISEALMSKMTGQSWHENNDIQFKDLRLITVTYFGYDDQDHIGEIIVHKVVASDVISIFKGAYEQSYPFEKIVPIFNYEGSDKKSMADNNTSAFNYRTVSGKDYLSMHAYGIAIDVSPVANPYVSKKGIYPKTGTEYADRSAYQKGMIIKGDVLYKLFIDHGWKWGGDWNRVQDYQHFEKRAVLDKIQ